MQEPVELARELARIARDKQLAEIEYRNDTTRLKLVFEKPTPTFVNVAQGAPTESAPRTPASAPVPQVEAAEPTGWRVISPLAGVFYRSPRPGAASFVEVGASLAVGDTLCIIEAMKMMNEITAEVPMRVLKVLVDNATVVAADQALFEYEPLG